MHQNASNDTNPLKAGGQVRNAGDESVKLTDHTWRYDENVRPERLAACRSESEKEEAMPEEVRVNNWRADPSALGFAGFAVATFLGSLYNLVGLASIPFAFFLFALLYGGLAEFVAGLFAYRREDTFSATVFTSYGAFYLAMGTMGWLISQGRLIPGIGERMGLAWVLLAFAVVNLGFLLQSIWMNWAVTATMAGIELTEILLLIGYFAGEGAASGLVAVAGGVGILTALLACYAATACLVNSMAGSDILPVGRPITRPQRLVTVRQHAA
jgi:uncharacterized protein